jgi:hypothetical protein
MTLRDDTSLSPTMRVISLSTGVTPRSNGSSHGHTGVTVIVPTTEADAHHVDSLLEWLPAVVDEVILVDVRSPDRPDSAALRAGFVAARGECIVMIGARDRVERGAMERFIDSLRSGNGFRDGSRFARVAPVATARAATA